MTNLPNTSTLPSLDAMLSTLLLISEGEPTFEFANDEAQELRHLFFPVTRHAVYLNHAANGPLSYPVARTLHAFVDDLSEFGNLHFSRWDAHERGVHSRLASFLGVRPDQVALTASTGDGLMTVANGLVWQTGDEIITAEGEFPSNVYPWLNLAEQGVTLRMVPLRENRVVVEDVLALMNERTRLVSLGLVAFSSGFRNDIAAIARHCHARGILCGIDAMQALGVLNVNVPALGVDFLAGAAHKWLLGPQTCGLLYVADDLLARLHHARRGWQSVAVPFDFFNYQQPLKDGAARLEHSSSNRLPIVGLDAALSLFEHLGGGIQAVEQRVLGLSAQVIAGLERLNYPVVTPQGAGERSGIVCFKSHPRRPDLGPQQIVSALITRDISAAARGDVVRISPHFYNTPQEIDTLLNVLEEIGSAGE